MNENPVEIAPPNISVYRHGNTGVDYATTFDSGHDGPHVMLTAIVHGNELCGAIVLDSLFRENLRPLRGKLTLAFCNVAAYARFDPEKPEDSRKVDEDFNRLWSSDKLDTSRVSVELARARELRLLVDQADFLLDLHSMSHPSEALILAGPLEKGRALAREVGFPALVVCDEGHAAGRRMRDYDGFGDPSSPKNALLVECGQHWSRRTVEVARETALRFLARFGLIDAERAGVGSAPAPQRVVEVTHPVTIATEGFQFAAPYTGGEVIESEGTLIGWDGDQEVRTPYDHCVLVMPAKRLERGHTAVRLGRLVS
jgi:predicted deacylase